MSHLARINVVALLILSLAVAPVVLQAKAAQAFVQDRCEAELKQAEEKYYAGLFDEAIVLLQSCLDKNSLTAAEKTKTLELMALAYLAKDYLDQARNALRKLLDIVPTYEPDPVQDPPQFTNLVREMKAAIEKEKKEREQAKEQVVSTEPVVQMPPAKKGGGKTWLVIGGGVVVGAATFLLIGKKKDDEVVDPIRPLPVPPNPPNQ